MKASISEQLKNEEDSVETVLNWLNENEKTIFHGHTHAETGLMALAKYSRDEGANIEPFLRDLFSAQVGHISMFLPSPPN